MWLNKGVDVDETKTDDEMLCCFKFFLFLRLLFSDNNIFELKLHSFPVIDRFDDRDSIVGSLVTRDYFVVFIIFDELLLFWLRNSLL
jgi:hypothetical protein